MQAQSLFYAYMTKVGMWIASFHNTPKCQPQICYHEALECSSRRGTTTSMQLPSTPAVRSGRLAERTNGSLRFHASSRRSSVGTVHLVLVRSWTHNMIYLRNRVFTCGLTPTYRPTGTVGREERVYYAKFTRPSLFQLRVWYPDYPPPLSTSLHI